VRERRGLERVAAPLAAEVARGQAPKLLIEDGQELVQGLVIAPGHPRHRL